MANPHSTGTLCPSEVQYPDHTRFTGASPNCIREPGPSLYGKPVVSDAAKRLAKNVRLLRVSHSWSQETLAELAGLDRTFVGAVERAERNITLATAEKLANAFGMTVADLLSPHDLKR